MTNRNRECTREIEQEIETGTKHEILDRIREIERERGRMKREIEGERGRVRERKNEKGERWRGRERESEREGFCSIGKKGSERKESYETPRDREGENKKGSEGE